ncbi:YSIRK-type signal peptide-containing protein [uncultured Limosilactobacillus sp.]|uniref:mucin-binding protein n=1 Tax=uncultured Limosilactobacillus sp. TaxID=2837629 RepID=UPI0025E738B3|nr:YSIRK-type signal peptide-containing protein [uncultured Limosilactobacillus sp.]
MVSKNNWRNKLEQNAHRRPHYGLRKLSVGVASVLLGTTLYLGGASTVAHAATQTVNVPANSADHAAKQTQSDSQQLQAKQVTLDAAKKAAPAAITNAQSAARQARAQQATDLDDNKVAATKTATNSASQTQSTLTVDAGNSTVSEDSGQIGLTWKVANYHRGDTFRIEVPQSTWLHGVHVSPISNAYINSDSGSNLQEGPVTLSVTMNNDSVGTISVPITLSIKSYIDLKYFGDFQRQIKIYQNDDQTPLAQLTLVEHIPQPKLTVTTDFSGAPGTTTNEGAVPGGTDGLTYQTDNGYSDASVTLTHFKMVVNVPKYFQATGIDNTSINAQNIKFTQEKAGSPITITADSVEWDPKQNNRLFVINGKYENFTRPEQDQQVSIDGGQITAQLAGQPVTINVPGYKELIRAVPQVLKGDDLRYHNITQGLHIYDPQKETELGESSWGSNMNKDHHNLDDLPSYHDLTITRNLSDDYVITRLTGFNKAVKSVNVTDINGQTKTYTVNNGSIDFGQGQRVVQFSYQLPAQLPADFGETVQLFGYLSKTHRDGSKVAVGDQLVIALEIKRGQTTVLDLNKSKETAYVAGYKSTTVEYDLKQGANVDPGSAVSLTNRVDGFGYYTHNVVSDQVSKSDYAGLETTIVKNPQFWIILPKTVSGADHWHNDGSWLLTTSTVNGRMVLHFVHRGTVEAADLSELIYELPHDFVTGWAYLNQSDQGAIYFTADNISKLNLTNQAATSEQVQGLPGVAGHDVRLVSTFSARVQTATGHYLNAKAQGNLDAGLAVRGTSTYVGTSKLHFVTTVANADSQDYQAPTLVINLPTTSDEENVATYLDKDSIHVVDTKTGKEVTGVTVLASTTAVNVSGTDKVSRNGFVPLASLSTDKLKAVKSLMLIVNKLSANDSFQVSLDVIPVDGSLVPAIGKKATIAAQSYSEQTLPINAEASIDIVGQATVHERVHYVDKQGQEHTIALEDQQTNVGNDTKGLVYDQNNQELAATIPDGFKLDSTTVINGAKTWQGDDQHYPNGKLNLNGKITYDADDDTIQYELVPAKQETMKVEIVDISGKTLQAIKTLTFHGTGNTTLSADDVKQVNDYLSSQHDHYQVVDISGISDMSKSWLAKQGLSDWTLPYSMAGQKFSDGQETVVAIPVSRYKYDSATVPMLSSASVAVEPANSSVKPLDSLPDDFRNQISETSFDQLTNDVKNVVQTAISGMVGNGSIYKRTNLQTGKISYLVSTSGYYEMAQRQAAERGINLTLTQKGSTVTLTIDLSKLGAYEQNGDQYKLVAGWQKYDGLNGTLRSKFEQPVMTVQVKLSSLIDAYDKYSNGQSSAAVPAGTLKVNGQDLGQLTIDQINSMDQPAIKLVWKYTQDPENCTVTYQYVDANDNYQPISGVAPVKVAGQAGESKDVHLPTIPAGYQLAADAQVPTTVTLDGTKTVNIPLVHQQKNDPKTGEVTRQYRIIEKMPDGTTKVIHTATITYHGQVVTDAVTGKPVLKGTPDSADLFKTDDSDSRGDKYGVRLSLTIHDRLNGYPVTVVTPNGWTTTEVPEGVEYDDAATGSGYTLQDQYLNINFNPAMPSMDFYLQAQPSKLTVTYQTKDGQTVGKQELTGKPGDAFSTNNEKTTLKLPAGYVGVDGQDPLTQIKNKYKGADGQPLTSFQDTPQAVTVVVDHKIDQISHKQPVPEGGKTSTGKPVDGAHDADLNQTVTRTIITTDPHGHQTTVTQTAKISRDATVDEVTGEVTNYGNWSTDKTNWTAVPTNAIPGYTAHIKIDGQDANDIPPVTVQDGQNDVKVNITYTPNDQPGKISYVDVDDHGKEVGQTPLTGKTDSDVTVTPEIPTGYEQVPDQTIPSTEKATSTGIPTVTVKVQHKIDQISHKKPVPEGGKTPTGKPADGAHDTDLNKTITRTITTTDQHGHQTTVTQTAKISRDAKVDEVTGKVVHYGDWSKDKTDWTAVTPTPIDGYTAHIKIDGQDANDIPAVTVQDGQKDVKVNITYTPKDQKGYISYKDIDDHGKEVGQTQLKGQTDHEVTVTTDIPTGFEEVPGQHIPATVTAGTAGVPTVTVNVRHKKVTVTPGQPKTPADTLPDNPGKKYPAGVAKDDLNKTITRTIIVNKPNGTHTTEKQTVTLTRTATVDEVNGTVTPGTWSKGHFDEYDVPEIPGYTPTKDKVPSVSVSSTDQDQKVTVDYKPNQYKGTITYVDSHNQPVGEKSPLSGKTGETITVVPHAPAGWKISEGQHFPITQKVTAKGITEVTMKVEHATTTVQPTDPKTPGDTLPDNPGKKYPAGVDQDDLNKTVTRTITVVEPNGTREDHSQTVHFTRTATVDEVTGQVQYSGWKTSNDRFAAYSAPQIAGYTADKTAPQIDGVTISSQPEPVEIQYRAVPSEPTKQTPGNGQSTTPTPGQAQSSTAQGSQPAGQAQAAAKKDAALPQTGNDHAGGLVSLGFASLLGMMGLLGGHRRKND